MDFAAAFLRKNLSRVEQAGWIKNVAKPAHEIEFRLREEQRHQPVLFHPDAMFSGDRAAQLDTHANDFGPRLPQLRSAVVLGPR